MQPSKRKKIAAAAVLAAAIALFSGAKYFLDSCYYPPVLMYHNIEKVPFGGGLYVMPKEFDEQMKFLFVRKYNVVTAGKLARMMESGERIPHNTVAVTIDDGNENNYINAFPILREYGLPATIFVVSDYISTGGHLTALEIREMAGEGIEFGSHTKSHLNLKEASRQELAEEAAQSKRSIEIASGKPVDVFCYPFGESNPSGTEMLKAAGYKGACVNMPRDGSVAMDPFNIKRIKVSMSKANMIVFRAKISGYYTWFQVHKWKKKK